MLERYFTARMTLRRLRFGPSGPYIDGFAAVLERDGYAKAIAKRYLRAAVHLGYFLQQQGKALSDIDSMTPEIFSRHLPTCCCPLSTGEGNNHHPYFGTKRFCDYLVQIGVCRSPVLDIGAPEPPVVTSFRQWLRRHRGVAEPTIKQYCGAAGHIMIALGDDRSCWNAKDVRDYFLGRAGKCGAGTVEKLITSLPILCRRQSTTQFNGMQLLHRRRLVVSRPTPPLQAAQNRNPHRLTTLKLDLRSHASRVTSGHTRWRSSDAYDVADDINVAKLCARADRIYQDHEHFGRAGSSATFFGAMGLGCVIIRIG